MNKQIMSRAAKLLTHTLLATCIVFAYTANADNPKVKMNTNKDIMDKISRVRTTTHGPFAADAPMIPVSIRSIVVVASDHKN